MKKILKIMKTFYVNYIIQKASAAVIKPETAPDTLNIYSVKSTGGKIPYNYFGNHNFKTFPL